MFYAENVDLDERTGKLDAEYYTNSSKHVLWPSADHLSRHVWTLQQENVSFHTAKKEKSFLRRTTLASLANHPGPLI